jgi:hypothetical protein
MPNQNTVQPRAAGQAAHTPTPWRAVILSRQIEHEKPNQHAYPIKPVGGNFLIANVTLAYPALKGDHTKLDYAQGEANAAFIVTACNAHESDQLKIAELVEALKPFAAMSCSPAGECKCYNCIARDALASTQGGAK